MGREIWKDVVGYEGIYQVSNTGRVKSFQYDKNGQILKPARHRNGYRQISLWRDGKRKSMLVHRLVLETFIGHAPSPKHQGNHRNGDRADNRAENLEWVTCSENHKHSYRALGRQPPGLRGEANGGSKLTRRKVRQIRKLSTTGEHTQAELGEMFGVHRSIISRIARRESWQHI